MRGLGRRWQAVIRSFMGEDRVAAISDRLHTSTGPQEQSQEKD